MKKIGEKIVINVGWGMVKTHCLRYLTPLLLEYVARKEKMKTKLLFVCSMGVDRSPAAASLFEKSEEYEAKFVGISPLADVEISREAVLWADKIFAMEHEHKQFLIENFKEEIRDKAEIIVLNVKNDFCRYDPALTNILKEKLKEWLK